MKFTASGLPEADRPSGSGKQLNLKQAAVIHTERKQLPTPTSTNGLRGGGHGAASDHHPGKWQSPGHPEYGELNPEWVEWIMGWPIGWTGLAAMSPEAFTQWAAMSTAGPDGRAPWWQQDPSDFPELGLPKTVVPADKRADEVRVSRIAALGNGQVSAACAGAYVFLSGMSEPPESVFSETNESSK